LLFLYFQDHNKLDYIYHKQFFLLDKGMEVSGLLHFDELGKTYGRNGFAEALTLDCKK